MEIKEFQNKDIRKVIQFAINGMHLDLYLKNKLLLNLYGRYFWYLETNRATHVIAAYEGDTLAGVMLAEMNDKPKKYYSKWKSAYVRFVDFVQKVFFKESAGSMIMLIKKCLQSTKKRTLLMAKSSFWQRTRI